jgi:hypothetical protein
MQKSSHLSVLDFDQTITIGHTFSENSLDSHMQKGLDTPDKSLQAGIDDAKHNIKAGIHKDVIPFKFSAEAFFSIATYHNNPDFIMGYLSALLGKKITAAKTTTADNGNIALRECIVEGFETPLLISYIPKTGAQFQEAMAKLHGKNEQIGMITDALKSKGIMKELEPFDYYDDSKANIDAAVAVPYVTAHQVNTNATFEKVDQPVLGPQAITFNDLEATGLVQKLNREQAAAKAQATGKIIIRPASVGGLAITTPDGEHYLIADDMKYYPNEYLSVEKALAHIRKSFGPIDSSTISFDDFHAAGLVQKLKRDQATLKAQATGQIIIREASVGGLAITTPDGKHYLIADDMKNHPDEYVNLEKALAHIKQTFGPINNPTISFDALRATGLVQKLNREQATAKAQATGEIILREASVGGLAFTTPDGDNYLIANDMKNHPDKYLSVETALAHIRTYGPINKPSISLDDVFATGLVQKLDRDQAVLKAQTTGQVIIRPASVGGLAITTPDGQSILLSYLIAENPSQYANIEKAIAQITQTLGSINKPAFNAENLQIAGLVQNLNRDEATRLAKATGQIIIRPASVGGLAITDPSGKHYLISDEIKRAPQQYENMEKALAYIKQQFGPIYRHGAPIDPIVQSHQPIAPIQAVPDKSLEVLEALTQGTISLEDAVKQYPANEAIIKKVVEKGGEDVLRLANPDPILNLVRKGTIAPSLVLKVFPDNKHIVTAAYRKDPTIIKDIPMPLLLTLVREGKVIAEEAVKIYPANEEIICAAVGFRGGWVLKLADPTTVISLINNGKVKPSEAVGALPYNKEVVTAAYQKNPKSIGSLPVPPLLELIAAGIIKGSDAIKIYPHDKSVITACYKIEPACISAGTHTLILELMNSGVILPKDAIKAFPTNQSIITAGYMIEPSSIQHAEPSHVLQLMNKGIISSRVAVQAFPDNEAIVKKVAEASTRLQVDAQKEVVQLITSGKLSPHEAVIAHPKNLAIIEAAYKKDASSLKHVDVEIINKLGAARVIKVEDVLSVFSKTMPTDAELEQTKTQFSSAKANNKWQEVASICRKFWFEKPSEANRDVIVQQLSQNKRWTELYEFSKAFKIEDYQLVEGPLPKSLETYQLEELARKMMKDGDFKIKNIDGDDHFVFTDGTQFNWTKIRANADLQHIDLDESDFASYKTFMHSGNIATTTLQASQEAVYRAELYKGQKIPDSPITFGEMVAINVYTGGFYKQMNGLMRDDPRSFDYRNASNATTRSALVHSVLSASGLRKVPVNSIKTSYRGSNWGSDEEQQQRVEAAAKHGVVELGGFVSSGIIQGFSKVVAYTFNNLRGAYIASISQVPSEREFLIPPTQLQISSYKHNGGIHSFTGSLVSELGIKMKQGPTPEDALPLAKPETVISLVNKGEITPANAVKAFPDDRDVVLACYQKDQTSIAHASESLQQLAVAPSAAPQEPQHLTASFGIFRQSGTKRPEEAQQAHKSAIDKPPS